MKISKYLAHVLFSFVLFLPLVCFAENAAGDQSVVKKGFSEFEKRVDTIVKSGISEPSLVSFVDFLFISLATFLIARIMVRYAFGSAGITEIIEGVLLILIVHVLMRMYDESTSALWSLTAAVSGALQRGMIGNDDLFFAPKFLTDVFQQVTFSGNAWSMPFRAMKAALLVVLASGFMIILSMLAYISAIWGHWGYALAKLFGLITVPTLLFERISFLFDGWLRFFLGWIVYGIIARLNLVLVAVSFALYLGIGIPPTAPSKPIEIKDVESFFEIFGLLCFCLLGIMSLFSTGRFAATILSGAGGGGMGPAINGIAKVAAKAMMK